MSLNALIWGSVDPPQASQRPAASRQRPGLPGFTHPHRQVYPRLFEPLQLPSRYRGPLGQPVQPFAALRVLSRPDSVVRLIAGFILHQSFHTDAAAGRTRGKQDKWDYKDDLSNHAPAPPTPSFTSLHAGRWARKRAYSQDAQGESNVHRSREQSMVCFVPLYDPVLPALVKLPSRRATLPLWSVLRSCLYRWSPPSGHDPEPFLSHREGDLQLMESEPQSQSGTDRHHDRMAISGHERRHPETADE
jgi:hypothetical protein